MQPSQSLTAGAEAISDQARRADRRGGLAWSTAERDANRRHGSTEQQRQQQQYDRSATLRRADRGAADATVEVSGAPAASPAHRPNSDLLSRLHFRALQRPAVPFSSPRHGSPAEVGRRSKLNQLSFTSVVLPDQLEILKLSTCYRHSLVSLKLPRGLHTLILGDSYNTDFRVDLPSSLTELQFGHNFNQPVFLWPKLPSGLLTLIYGFEFNHPVEDLKLPANLTSLKFGGAFHQPIDRLILPASLQTLHFDSNLNQPLTKVHLPSSLTSLTLGQFWNQPFETVRLPQLTH